MSKKRPRFKKEEVDSLDEKVEEKEQEREEYDAFGFMKEKKKAAAVAGIFFIIGFFVSPLVTPSFTGMTVVEDVSADKAEVAATTVDYVNRNMLPDGLTATLVSIRFESGLYVIDLSVDSPQGSQDFVSYVSSDGKLLFIQGIDMTEEVPEAPPAQPQPAPDEPSRVSVSADDDPSWGPADAPVTIVEFSDFQCPYCARVAPTIKQIKETYGDSVRIVYRDYPLPMHENAQKAAEAAECADDQGTFWEYHDMLFANQGALDAASLKRYAGELELNTAEFDSCLDSGKHADEVRKDMAEGSSYGVSGTPAFFVNGILVSGAQPFSAFQQIIDSELNK